jgi:hypothetical protein
LGISRSDSNINSLRECKELFMPRGFLGTISLLPSFSLCLVLAGAAKRLSFHPCFPYSLGGSGGCLFKCAVAKGPVIIFANYLSTRLCIVTARSSISGLYFTDRMDPHCWRPKSIGSWWMEHVGRFQDDLGGKRGAC